jgi:hypothetical protein
MSTKQQKLQARRATKAKARSVAKKAQIQKDRQVSAKLAAAKKESQIGYSIATQGVIQTAEALRKGRGKKGKNQITTMTNVEVLVGINEAIPVLAGVHGAMEVYSNLALEKKVEMLPHHVDMFETFDRNVVSITEDINAIYELIEKGLTPDQYLEVFIHYIDALANVYEFGIPEMLREVLKPAEALINQYVREHKEPEEADVGYGMRSHEARMQRVAPLYRTKSIAADLTDPIPVPGEASVGELVEDDDFSAELAKPINDPLTC